MSAPLYLARARLNAAALFRFAKSRGLLKRSTDDGYLIHCVLTEIWQGLTLSPFTHEACGRFIDVWGYTRTSADDLQRHAQQSRLSATLKAVVFNDMQINVSTRKLPHIVPGKRLSLLVRACPVVRLSSNLAGYGRGAELDAYQAHMLRPQEHLSREQLYCAWLGRRLQGSDVSGLNISSIYVRGMSLTAVLRRTHGEDREAKALRRPDVSFGIEAAVQDSAKFTDLLAKGIGRHRAFGFGAILMGSATHAADNSSASLC